MADLLTEHHILSCQNIYHVLNHLLMKGAGRRADGKDAASLEKEHLALRYGSDADRAVRYA